MTAAASLASLDWHLHRLEQCLNVVETSRQALEAVAATENDPAVSALVLAYGIGLKRVAKARKHVEKLRALHAAPAVI